MSETRDTVILAALDSDEARRVAPTPSEQTGGATEEPKGNGTLRRYAAGDVFTWECAECCFEFLAKHTDEPDGTSYSCPVCALSQARSPVERQKKASSAIEAYNVELLSRLAASEREGARLREALETEQKDAARWRMVRPLLTVEGDYDEDKHYQWVRVADDKLHALTARLGWTHTVESLVDTADLEAQYAAASPTERPDNSCSVCGHEMELDQRGEYRCPNEQMIGGVMQHPTERPDND